MKWNMRNVVAFEIGLLVLVTLVGLFSALVPDSNAGDQRPATGVITAVVLFVIVNIAVGLREVIRGRRRRRREGQ